MDAKLPCAPQNLVVIMQISSQLTDDKSKCHENKKGLCGWIYTSYWERHRTSSLGGRSIVVASE